MSDKAATILAAAIIIFGLLYFASHLHASLTGPGFVYNTVTGNMHRQAQ